MFSVRVTFGVEDAKMFSDVIQPDPKVPNGLVTLRWLYLEYPSRRTPTSSQPWPCWSCDAPIEISPYAAMWSLQVLVFLWMCGSSTTTRRYGGIHWHTSHRGYLIGMMFIVISCITSAVAAVGTFCLIQGGRSMQDWSWMRGHFYTFSGSFYMPLTGGSQMERLRSTSKRSLGRTPENEIATLIQKQCMANQEI